MVNLECLVKDSVCRVFNSHLRMNFSFIPGDAWGRGIRMGHIQSLHSGGSCLELWLEGHWCLSWQQTKVPMVKEAVKMKKEAFWVWLAQGSSEAADRYQEARRAAASVVAEARTRVWEEFREAMEKNYQLASRKFWQTIQ